MDTVVDVEPGGKLSARSEFIDAPQWCWATLLDMEPGDELYARALVPRSHGKAPARVGSVYRNPQSGVHTSVRPSGVLHYPHELIATTTQTTLIRRQRSVAAQCGGTSAEWRFPFAE